METTNSQHNGALAIRADFSQEQVDLLKRTICKGSTDDELAMFVATANRMGLDPFARQIFAVKRWDSRERREVMSIQVSIDGFRLVAERTGNYAPGPEPRFEHDKEGRLIKATATVKKFARGEWHLVEASAYWDEYVQRNKDGQPNRMWQSMPHVMLPKCAEAQALRKAFPAELSGVYTPDEMGQSENETAEAKPVATEKTTTPSAVKPKRGAIKSVDAMADSLMNAPSKATVAVEYEEAGPQERDPFANERFEPEAAAPQMIVATDAAGEFSLGFDPAAPDVETFAGRFLPLVQAVKSKKAWEEFRVQWTHPLVLLYGALEARGLTRLKQTYKDAIAEKREKFGSGEKQSKADKLGSVPADPQCTVDHDCKGKRHDEACPQWIPANPAT